MREAFKTFRVFKLFELLELLKLFELFKLCHSQGSCESARALTVRCSATIRVDPPYPRHPRSVLSELLAVT